MTVVSLVVEGEGDRVAVPELFRRIVDHLGEYDVVVAPGPIMCRGIDVLRVLGGIERFYEFAAAKPNVDCVVIAVDCEDLCPREVGSDLNARLVAHGISKPASIVLFHREYETLFLECFDDIRAARPDIFDDRACGQPIVPTTRDAKGAVKSRLVSRSYRETRDQVKLTALLNIGTAVVQARAVRRCHDIVQWIKAGHPGGLKSINK